MGGIVINAEDQVWSVSSSVFYWAIETLAEHVQDPDFAAELQEISDENLGALAVNDLPPKLQHDLSATAARLPDIARATLPQSDEREVVIGQIKELAQLLAPA